MKKPRVYRSKEFKSWYRSLAAKEKGIVDTRIDMYRDKGELVKTKSLDQNFGLYEFKWDSGLRIYFSFIEDGQGNLMLLLLGGNKNSQDKDITEAKNIVLKAVKGIEKKRKAKTTKKKATKKIAKKK